MSELREIGKARARANERTPIAVAEARATGSDWPEIAEALGVSRQAVRQRFGTKK